jgi:hypothetical protein
MLSDQVLLLCFSGGSFRSTGFLKIELSFLARIAYMMRLTGALPSVPGPIDWTDRLSGPHREVQSHGEVQTEENVTPMCKERLL